MKNKFGYSHRLKVAASCMSYGNLQSMKCYTIEFYKVDQSIVIILGKNVCRENLL